MSHFRTLYFAYLGIAACSPNKAPAPQAPETAPRLLPQLQDTAEFASDGVYTVATWEAQHQPLREAPDASTVTSLCSTCHSTAYISAQPPFAKDTWQAIVDKMIKMYGAQIPPQDYDKVVDYLATYYGNTQMSAVTQQDIPGKEVYARTCVVCHQSSGQGLPNAYPPLAGHIAELLQKDATRQHLIRVVLYGLQGKITVNNATYHAAMPALEYLSDADIAADLNYVARAFGNEAQLAKDFVPFDVAEIARERQKRGTALDNYSTRVQLGLP